METARNSTARNHSDAKMPSKPVCIDNVLILRQKKYLPPLLRNIAKLPCLRACDGGGGGGCSRAL